MSKRSGGKKRKWTLQMNNDLLECRRKAELLVASEGRKALWPLWRSFGKKLGMLSWILQAKIYWTRWRAWRRLWECNGNYYLVSGSKRSRITGIWENSRKHKRIWGDNEYLYFNSRRSLSKHRLEFWLLTPVESYLPEPQWSIYNAIAETPGDFANQKQTKTNQNRHRIHKYGNWKTCPSTSGTK